MYRGQLNLALIRDLPGEHEVGQGSTKAFEAIMESQLSLENTLFLSLSAMVLRWDRNEKITPKYNSPK